MKAKLATPLLGGACLLALGSPVLAQQHSEPTTIEEVVVTGSRIIRDGYENPTPMTVARTEDLQSTTPSNIPDALNKLPQFAGSTQSSGTSNAGGPSTIYTGNYLNLRSMTAIRTLILLNGDRVAPTAINGTVDTNTLPQLLVSRVDVVTGGASAVYGSDAVTGVVNFVVDTKFRGFKALAQTGISDKNDVPSSRFGFAFGTPIFDRGHVVVSAEHFQNAGLKRFEDRDDLAPMSYVGTGTAANPFTLIANPRIATTAYGGLATSGPFAGKQFVGAGVLAPYNAGTPTKNPGLSSGGDGVYYYDSPATASLRTDQLYGRFQYDLDDNITGFVQLNFAETRLPDYHRSNTPELNLTIFADNAYLPADARAMLAGANLDRFTLNRFPRDFALKSSVNQLTDAFNFTGGLTGKIRDNYVWEASYSHSVNRIRSHRYNNINFQHLYAAVDAVSGPGGAPVCRVTLTSPTAYPGCKPINLLGAGNASGEALDYVFEDTNWQVVNTMDDFSTSVSGDLLQGWAGPLSAALNFEYRKQSMEQSSSATPTDPVSLTGVRFGAPPRSLWAFDTVSNGFGQNSVWEVGGELAFPLLKDKPWAKALEVNGALRYTEYSSSGPATTWKIGLNYQPVEDLRFRYAESRDIRAPSLTDLYSSATLATGNINDPHTGRNGLVSIVGGGNPDLAPEVSRTTTLGVVYRPSWLQGFQMSVDYFDIQINNAITTLTGTDAAVLSECEAANGASPLCDLITRPLAFSDRTAANFPTRIHNINLNVAKTFTHGYDVEANYGFDLDRFAEKVPGRINLRLLYTYQPELKTKKFETSPVTEAAGVLGLPAHRASLTTNYLNGPFGMAWQVRYSGKMALSGNPLVIYADAPVDSLITQDLNVDYRFKVRGQRLQAFFSVSNLFDKEPRIGPGTVSAGIPGVNSPALQTDDIIGRYYTLGLRYAF